MTLHDAIYEPRVEHQVREMKFTPTVEDNTRRRLKLNEENVQILDFDEIEKLEKKQKPTKTNKIQMPKPKPTLWDRFISLFR